MQSIHIPVLPVEVLEWLTSRDDRDSRGMTIIDGTFGGGGHAKLLAEQVGETGLIIGIDRDPESIDRATHDSRLAGLPIKVVQGAYTEIPLILEQLGIEKVDGVLLDLGLSSDQLEDADRGFSYTSDGELDLRFDPNEGEPAWRMLQRIKAEHLADVIYEFGEERYSRRIARAIVERRRSDPIKTSRQLADLVMRCVPHKSKSKEKTIHPATRTFQALRIAVNQELKLLDEALRTIPNFLADRGRFAIISFHSLEDRPVKQTFRDDDRLEVLTKKPVIPTDDEIAGNPRSRSAKLRVAERKCRVA